MKINNIRILTKQELAELEKSYIFEISGDKILVKSIRFSDGYAHSLNESFSLNMPKYKTKITFSVFAINTWNTDFKSKYSLFKVQNAVNILQILHQSLTVNNIKNILERESVEIKII